MRIFLRYITLNVSTHSIISRALIIETSLIKLEQIEGVLNIQRHCYPQYYVENKDVFERMIAVYPSGCLGVSFNGILTGYVFFHPYYEDKIKPLNHSLRLDGSEDCMYLHDMAIQSEYRGMGLTRILMDKVDIETRNRKLTIQTLVAVQESHYFWKKYGFKPVNKIEKYGGSAAYYMKRRLHSLKANV